MKYKVNLNFNIEIQDELEMEEVIEEIKDSVNAQDLEFAYKRIK